MTAPALKSLLYVDDDPDIREIVQMSLTLDGDLVVHLEGEGERALDTMRLQLPDLVVLDFMMPGMDGPAIVERMRADALLRHIPVIYMTAKANAQEIARIGGTAAIGVIAKPFDPMALGSQVKALWKSHHE